MEVFIKMGLFNKLTMNVGKSIKQIAKINYYIQLAIAAVCLIFTIFCFGDGCDTGNEDKLIMALAGFITFIFVAINSAFSVILLYGFGELIECSKNTNQNSNSIKENTNNIENIDRMIDRLMALKEKETVKTECKTKSDKNRTEESDKQLSEEEIMQSVFDRFKYGDETH